MNATAAHNGTCALPIHFNLFALFSDVCAILGKPFSSGVQRVPLRFSSSQSEIPSAIPPTTDSACRRCRRTMNVFLPQSGLDCSSLSSCSPYNRPLFLFPASGKLRRSSLGLNCVCSLSPPILFLCCRALSELALVCVCVCGANRPKAFSFVWRADVGSGYNSPRHRIPHFGNVREYNVKSSSNKQVGVFQEHVLWSNFANDSSELFPKSRFFSADSFAFY